MSRLQPTAPLSNSLFDTCAQYVLKHFSDRLPMLNDVIIVLPYTTHAGDLRRSLLQHSANQALLPPHITTLPNLIKSRTQEVPTSYQRCLLLLGSALSENKSLFPRTNCWRLANDLLVFFNDIDEHNDFEKNYKLLSDESKHIAQIYSIWHENKPPNNEYDLRRNALRTTKLIEPHETVILCGFDKLTPSEECWAANLEKEKKLVRIHELNTTDTPSDKDIFLNAVWNLEAQTLLELSEQSRQSFPQSVIENKLKIFTPKDIEEHIHGIYTQVKQWHEQGIRNIALVTQDRQLLRRLRAVLFEKQIPIVDHSGWALSTAMSSTMVEQLLTALQAPVTIELVEYLMVHTANERTDPYINTSISIIKSTLAEADYVIETLEDLLKALNASSSREHQIVAKHVQHIQQALQALTDIPIQKQHSFDALFEALDKSMQSLHVDQKFDRDKTGKQVLEHLQTLRTYAHQENLSGSIESWKDWISYTLEVSNFVPIRNPAGIQFCNVSQSLLLHTDAVIIASLDQSHNTPPYTTLLSDSSRADLGLQTYQAFSHFITDRFHRLIRRTNNVLLSCQTQNNGKSIMPLPWVEELEHFHQVTYQQSLIVEYPKNTDVPSGTVALTRPAPSVPAELLPKKLSANSYQTAVRCPYEFFSKYILNIYRQVIPTHDSNRLYGIKLHACIEAMHQGVEGLPGPAKRWHHEEREHLLQLGMDIIDALYPESMRTHYTVIAQIQKMQAAIKQYIPWFLETWHHNETHQLLSSKSEVEYTVDMANGIKAYGRADHVIKTSNNEQHILDYKSGKMPSKKNIENGNNVQIGFYALLNHEATHARYVSLADQKAIKCTSIDGEVLESVRQNTAHGLQNFIQDAFDGKPFSAWANIDDCQHCDYAGICRRQIWEDELTQATDEASTALPPTPSQ
ncbi:MAG: PD-(D/E)XK nuclease family protein [Candidatus Oxydemutatoraceae bacterium WSBS_2016_MAG_OTU14]